MKPQITMATLAEHRDAIANRCPHPTAIAYAQISQTQLSLGRYGGLTINGQRFVYQPLDDSLIRADVVKWLEKRIADQARQEKQARKAAGEAKQGTLL